MGKISNLSDLEHGCWCQKGWVFQKLKIYGDSKSQLSQQLIENGLKEENITSDSSFLCETVLLIPGVNGEWQFK